MVPKSNARIKLVVPVKRCGLLRDKNAKKKLCSELEDQASMLGMSSLRGRGHCRGHFHWERGTTCKVKIGATEAKQELNW